jgi:type IV secretory pathway VirD2 relaxase
LKNEQRQFRFIVSPEDGDALDLKEFARQFMKQVERDTGRQLIWAAVNHHNTANPHVHIVIRGVDRDGDDLRIDGRYIAQEMRWRAQEILTRELGLRSDLELEQGRSADVTREGFTSIDRMLARHLSDEGQLAPGQFADMPRLERAACLARLAKLEEMGLTRREAAGVWRMANDWEVTLKQLEIAGEVRQRIRRHVPASLGRGQVLQAGERFETVEGIVRGIGLHDELVGSMYLVVERTGGAACYLPVRPEVAEGLAVGDKVRVSCAAESWVKATDRIVARVAAEHGGIYDPAAHQQALSMRGGRDAGGGQPSSADLVAANVRRLERLERYGLVARDGAGRWRVPTDLVAKLEAREVSHPRHRIQIERLGPVRQIERTPLERPPGRGRGRGLSR